MLTYLKTFLSKRFQTTTYSDSATPPQGQESLFLAVQNTPSDAERLRPNIAQLVASILTQAITMGASDVHLEPSKNKLSLRFRVDGRLITHEPLELSLLPNLVSYLKITSNLDIAESRLPKDSSFRLTDLPETDFRLSILPTIFGEKVTLRLMHQHAHQHSLADERLFTKQDLTTVQAMLAKPNGCILVTGPTGSGKSTTLACFLAHLNQPHVNITTIEDPVEHVLPRVNHVNLNPTIGLDFNTLLRHILRQDPDIIMIGEIRDPETATTVVRAAITGHLVLSTLHTNNAISTINRLLDMGIPHYLLTDALAGVIAQRLVRRLCSHCKQPATLPPWLVDKYDIAGHLYEPVGCQHCNTTGYKGRLAIYELLDVTPAAKTYLAQRDLTGLATCFQPMHHHALSQLLAGHTSLEEIITFV